MRGKVIPITAGRDAERMVLGSILLNDSTFGYVASMLRPDAFKVERHRKIFRRMLDLHDREEKIDRITLANELMHHGELENVGGLSYLVSLDDGLPELYDLGIYVQIVLERAASEGHTRGAGGTAR